MRREAPEGERAMKDSKERKRKLKDREKGSGMGRKNKILGIVMSARGLGRWRGG